MDRTSVTKTPKFLRTLYTILHTEPTDILTWSCCGSFFQVLDVARMETHVLPRYFKHAKFASFQRQLNNFGFRKWTKTRASVCTFSHDVLVKCRPDELPAMMTMMMQNTESVATPSRKRLREEKTESPIATTTPCKKLRDTTGDSDCDESTRDSAVDVSDLWSLDWSVFYGDDIESQVDETTVGLPLELLFPELKTEELEPLLTAGDDDSELLIVDAIEWQLLADCLA